ncbi:unnamed protein product [Amoebophrya sp. A120]|nr:unnamed protein product [Amoebophrya sp. A120]|eukprot:GSA120T00005815001.1
MVDFFFTSSSGERLPHRGRRATRVVGRGRNSTCTAALFLYGAMQLQVQVGLARRIQVGILKDEKHPHHLDLAAIEAERKLDEALNALEHKMDVVPNKEFKHDLILPDNAMGGNKQDGAAAAAATSYFGHAASQESSLAQTDVKAGAAGEETAEDRQGAFFREMEQRFGPVVQEEAIYGGPPDPLEKKKSSLEQSKPIKPHDQQQTSVGTKSDDPTPTSSTSRTQPATDEQESFTSFVQTSMTLPAVTQMLAESLLPKVQQAVLDQVQQSPSLQRQVAEEQQERERYVEQERALPLSSEAVLRQDAGRDRDEEQGDTTVPEGHDTQLLQEFQDGRSFYTSELGQPPGPARGPGSGAQIASEREDLSSSFPDKSTTASASTASNSYPELQKMARPLSYQQAPPEDIEAKAARLDQALADVIRSMKRPPSVPQQMQTEEQQLDMDYSSVYGTTSRDEQDEGSRTRGLDIDSAPQADVEDSYAALARDSRMADPHQSISLVENRNSRALEEVVPSSPPTPTVHPRQKLKVQHAADNRQLPLREHGRMDTTMNMINKKQTSDVARRESVTQKRAELIDRILTNQKKTPIKSVASKVVAARKKNMSRTRSPPVSAPVAAPGEVAAAPQRSSGQKEQVALSTGPEHTEYMGALQPASFGLSREGEEHDAPPAAQAAASSPMNIPPSTLLGTTDAFSKVTQSPASSSAASPAGAAAPNPLYSSSTASANGFVPPPLPPPPPAMPSSMIPPSDNVLGAIPVLTNVAHEAVAGVMSPTLPSPIATPAPAATGTMSPALQVLDEQIREQEKKYFAGMEAQEKADGTGSVADAVENLAAALAKDRQNSNVDPELLEKTEQTLKSLEKVFRQRAVAGEGAGGGASVAPLSAADAVAPTSVFAAGSTTPPAHSAAAAAPAPAAPPALVPAAAPAVVAPAATASFAPSAPTGVTAASSSLLETQRATSTSASADDNGFVPPLQQVPTTDEMKKNFAGLADSMMLMETGRRTISGISADEKEETTHKLVSERTLTSSEKKLFDETHAMTMAQPHPKQQPKSVEARRTPDKDEESENSSKDQPDVNLNQKRKSEQPTEPHRNTGDDAAQNAKGFEKPKERKIPPPGSQPIEHPVGPATNPHVYIPPSPAPDVTIANKESLQSFLDHSMEVRNNAASATEKAMQAPVMVEAQRTGQQKKGKALVVSLKEQKNPIDPKLPHEDKANLSVKITDENKEQDGSLINKNKQGAGGSSTAAQVLDTITKTISDIGSYISGSGDKNAKEAGSKVKVSKKLEMNVVEKPQKLSKTKAELSVNVPDEGEKKNVGDGVAALAKKKEDVEEEKKENKLKTTTKITFSLPDQHSAEAGSSSSPGEDTAATSLAAASTAVAEDAGTTAAESKSDTAVDASKLPGGMPPPPYDKALFERQKKQIEQMRVIKDNPSTPLNPGPGNGNPSSFAQKDMEVVRGKMGQYMKDEYSKLQQSMLQNFDAFAAKQQDKIEALEAELAKEKAAQKLSHSAADRPVTAPPALSLLEIDSSKDKKDKRDGGKSAIKTTVTIDKAVDKEKKPEKKDKDAERDADLEKHAKTNSQLTNELAAEAAAIGDIIDKKPAGAAVAAPPTARPTSASAMPEKPDAGGAAAAVPPAVATSLTAEKQKDDVAAAAPPTPAKVEVEVEQSPADKREDLANFLHSKTGSQQTPTESMVTAAAAKASAVEAAESGTQKSEAAAAQAELVGADQAVGMALEQGPPPQSAEVKMTQSDPFSPHYHLENEGADVVISGTMKVEVINVEAFLANQQTELAVATLMQDLFQSPLYDLKIKLEQQVPQTAASNATAAVPFFLQQDATSIHHSVTSVAENKGQPLYLPMFDTSAADRARGRATATSFVQTGMGKKKADTVPANILFEFRVKKVPMQIQQLLQTGDIASKWDTMRGVGGIDQVVDVNIKVHENWATWNQTVFLPIGPASYSDFTKDIGLEWRPRVCPTPNFDPATIYSKQQCLDCVVDFFQTAYFCGSEQTCQGLWTECAVDCQQNPACKAFNYNGRLCRHVIPKDPADTTFTLMGDGLTQCGTADAPVIAQGCMNWCTKAPPIPATAAGGVGLLQTAFRKAISKAYNIR